MSEVKRNLLNLDNMSWKEGFYQLFLGERLGLHDTINTSYPAIANMYKKQKEIDWDENEVALYQDRIDMLEAPKYIVDLMIKNLMYQWEFDSIAAHSFLVILAPFITNPELWRTLVRFTDVECTHSATYSHIILNCIENTESVFEEIQKNEKIKGRMNTVEKAFEQLDHLSAKKRLADYDDSIVLPSDQEMFNAVFKFLWAMYLAEGLQFTVSFAATFVCGESQYFSGICALVQKIANDEVFCHAMNLHNVFQILLKDDPRAKIALQQLGPELKQMLKEVMDNEREWAKYLFSEGRKVVGLNYQLAVQYAEYRAFFIASTLGFNETDTPPDNPLPWMNRWLDIDSFQVALQEIDNTNYKKIYVTESTDLSNDLIGDFKSRMQRLQKK